MPISFDFASSILALEEEEEDDEEEEVELEEEEEEKDEAGASSGFSIITSNRGSLSFGEKIDDFLVSIFLA